ncbi:MAG: sigma-54 dependent transcriptional regulator [Thermoanaerobaculia bacterium]
MTTAEDSLPDNLPADIILEGVSTIFGSLGRTLICLNSSFQIVHASAGLDQLMGEGAAEAVIGKKAAEVLGTDLFGADGSMRKALEAGERREGWGATIRLDDARPRLVSITGAPIIHDDASVCDPRVSHVIVVRLGEENLDSGPAAPTIFSGLMARSTAMLDIFRLVQHLSESDATVLVGGESGTGKELVARAVHIHSPRRKGPFVALNCGALPGELLESELFGHVRGAFTGAIRNRVGRFELASGGTIFLDEVGDLPLHLQVKLLRVLQEKTFERVGDSDTRTTDARIIAATNKDLRQAIHDGTFRDDLFYRLRVVPIEIPPLRERREDIEPLARHLLARVSRRHDRSVLLSPDTMRALLRYSWPGNVRELENALEYAVAVSRGQTIHLQDLPLEITEIRASQESPGETLLPDHQISLPTGHVSAGSAAGAALDSEYDRLRAALDTHHWRRAETAAALGISRTTLWRKMRELGLPR